LAAFLRIHKRVQSSAPALVFDLITGKSVDVGGQSIRLSSAALPEPVVVGDCIEWRFAEPVRVSTPGPDARISVLKQWRDHLEFAVRPWADVRIDFE
jgi:hypothetical protein